VTAAAAMTHMAARPLWDCRACGEPWPCEPARAALMAERGMTVTRLTITMTAFLHAAVADGLHRQVPDGGLYSRFILWTRPDPPLLNSSP